MNDIVKDVNPGSIAFVEDEEPNVMGLIVKLASDPNFDADKLEKLVQMQERQEEKQAKKAFNISLAEFHENAPTIVKSKDGHNYKYAAFEDVVKAVRPALLKVGLTVSWSSEPFGQGETKVACILRHKLGHEEKSSLAGRPEDSGSKNSIQGVGSTDSYLRRYTMQSVLGLVAEGEDTDGNPSVLAHVIDDEQRNHIQTLVDSSQSDVGQFCRHFKVNSISGITNKRYGEAVNILNAKIKRNAK